MANSKSAEKRARQSTKRAMVNRAVKARVRSARKAVNEAIASGAKDEASSQLDTLASVADKAVKKGVIHKNSADRLKGLYSKRVAAIS
ncbi:MAG: 30S ribosomal protein S20 [Verrucomicrobiales bacterium]|nr:MAG: 30S ribosomal protein S20 [Verrucomicrobiaceae bacterium]|tara:strand:- start:115 stop:378 length:264 start_codon:yes stop_codon:yes gene_type:complete